MIARRSILTGLVALVAAPAIVKVSSLMPVNAALQPRFDYMSLNEITREAVRLFKDSNVFLKELDAQYAMDRMFYEGEQWDKVWLEQVDQQDAMAGREIGDVLRIRLGFGSSKGVR